MKRVSLGDVIDLSYGKAMPHSTRVHGDIPVYGSNGVVGYHNKSLVSFPTIIVGRKGSVGRVHHEISPCWVIDTAFYVRLKSQDVDLRYVYHVLKNIEERFTSAGKGVKPGISRPDYLATEITLPFKNGKPDLVEQKHIADELDGLLKLKDVATADIKKADAVIGSVSRAKFGNINETRAVKLGEICNITKGLSPTLKTKPGKYPLVVTAAERKSSDDHQFDDEAVCIPLVSSTGHGHASLNRIHYEEGQFALANIMVALTAKDKSEVDMKYLFHYLSYYRSELLVPLMRGVANVTIPFASFGQVVVRFPDIEEQRKVVSVFDEIEKLKQKLAQRNVLVSRLVPSVMNQSFAMQT